MTPKITQFRWFCVLPRNNRLVQNYEPVRKFLFSKWVSLKNNFRKKELLTYDLKKARYCNLRKMFLIRKKVTLPHHVRRKEGNIEIESEDSDDPDDDLDI